MNLATAQALPAECRTSAGTRFPRTLKLRAGQILRLTKEDKIVSLEVLEGVVWLTATPATEDILLGACERLEVRRGWPLILQSMKDARVLLR